MTRLDALRDDLKLVRKAREIAFAAIPSLDQRDLRVLAKIIRC
jgi:hypothetical protein